MMDNNIIDHLRPKVSQIIRQADENGVSGTGKVIDGMRENISFSFDELIDGGFHEKSLTLFMAETNIGKSLISKINV